MQPIHVAIRAALALVLAVCAGVPGRLAPSSAERPYVVLVSFDGFAADYLGRQRQPAFERLAARGVRAEAMWPAFPSKTFPNHYSIVTGLYPGHHGIVANAFWDPQRDAAFAIRDRAVSTDGSWYGGEPIWVTAERQGVRAASLFWPGSEGTIGGVRLATSLPYDESMPNDARVDSVAAWLRRPDATRPHLVLLYASIVDYAGHTYGPSAAETRAAVAAADRMLGRLLDSVAASPVGARTNVVVVSDHGMMDASRERVVELSRITSLDGVRTADPGPVFGLWFGADAARREAVYAALGRAFAAPGSHAHVYRRAETPERWHLRAAPRAGDLLVVADPGWLVYPSPPTSVPNGNHGWDPTLAPQMGAIFLAAGPDVHARGVIRAFPNVDVYPLLARMLRVTPATHLDGDETLVRAVAR